MLFHLLLTCILVQDLDEKELELARREYAEEYPRPGEGAIRLKSYPFKKYLDTKG